MSGRQRKYLRLRRTEQLCEQWQGVPIVLAAGLEETEQDALSVGTGECAISSPDFACDHHGADGLLSAPVGGFQSRTVKKGQDSVSFAQ